MTARDLDVASETGRLVGELRAEILSAVGAHALDSPGSLALEHVRAAAVGQASFEKVGEAVQRILDQTSRFDTCLRALQRKLTDLERRRVRFGAAWWARRRTEIDAAFQRGRDEGATLWARTIGEGLAGWALEGLEALGAESWPLPPSLSPIAAALPAALAAVRAGEWDASAVLDLPSLLVGAAASDGTPLLDGTVRSALLVFRGRIHLHEAGARDEAARDFEEAHRLAPHDALPLVALGELRLDAAVTRDAESQFQLALLASADEPQAHAGKGLCEERAERWEDATAAYDRAVEVAREYRDPIAALLRLRAPASGLLLLSLARAVSEEDTQEDAQTALGLLERALHAGVRGPAPARQAQRLRGDLLARVGRASEAAAAYTEAGLLHRRAGEHDDAVALLRRARELDRTPERAWELAEAHFLASSKRSGAEKASALEEGIAVWEEAYREGLPGTGHRWTYLSRARLVLEQATLAEDWRTRVERNAEAIAWTETYLLHDPQRELAWLVLGSGLAELRLERNALAASDRAAALDPDGTDSFLIEQRVIAHTNAGEADAAETLLARKYDLATNPWARWVQGVVHVWQHRYAETIRVAEQVAAAGDQPRIWFVEAVARARDQLGDPAADAEWQRVLDMCTTPESAESRAAALCRLGRPAEAVAALEPVLADPLRRAEATRNLIVARLLLGDVAASARLVDDALRWSHAGELRAWRDEDLRSPRLRRLFPPEVAELDARVAIAVDEPPPSPREELRWAAEALDVPRTGGWAEIALAASGAREALAAGDLDEAAALYRRLGTLRRPDGGALLAFPEARQGLKNVVAAATSGPLHSDGDAAATVARLELARAVAAEADDPALVVVAETRLGLLEFVRDRRREARSRLAAALRTEPAGEAPGLASATLVEVIPDLPTYFALVDALEAWASEGGDDAGGLSSALLAVRDGIGAYLDACFVPEPPASEPPAALPLVLDLSGDLVPEDTSGERWPLLRTLLPQVRERIREELGVEVPPIRVRQGPTLGPPWFRVLVHEAAVRTEFLVPAVGDPFPAIADRVRLIVAEHAAELMGLEQVDALVRSWRDAPALAALVDAALVGPQAMLWFARVVRALLREGVPLTRPVDVLEAVREAHLSPDPADCVRAVRARLRALLPGNDPRARRIELPDDLDDAIASWISHDRGRTFLAAPPGEIQAWLKRIGELRAAPEGQGSGEARRDVLVTADCETRAGLQRLVALECPGVATLSRDELLAGAGSHSSRAPDPGEGG